MYNQELPLALQRTQVTGIHDLFQKQPEICLPFLFHSNKPQEEGT